MKCLTKTCHVSFEANKEMYQTDTLPPSHFFSLSLYLPQETSIATSLLTDTVKSLSSHLK